MNLALGRPTLVLDSPAGVHPRRPSDHCPGHCPLSQGNHTPRRLLMSCLVFSSALAAYSTAQPSAKLDEPYPTYLVTRCIPAECVPLPSFSLSLPLRTEKGINRKITRETERDRDRRRLPPIPVPASRKNIETKSQAIRQHTPHFIRTGASNEEAHATCTAILVNCTSPLTRCTGRCSERYPNELHIASCPVAIDDYGAGKQRHAHCV